MTTINLITYINAPLERCFLLSLSVDLHQISTADTNERAIDGVTSGVMQLNDTVTWRAKHFGVYQNLTTKITAYEYPHYFVDEMTKGAFKKLYHKHVFESENDATLMTDIFMFEAPIAILGAFFSKIILKDYMQKFLVKRNNTIKQVAESNNWKNLIERT